MKIRTLLVVGALALFGGLALWDYYTPESQKARELHDLERLAALLGDEGVPLYAAVLDSCIVARTDVSPPACFALDALYKVQSPKAVAALEEVVKARKQLRPVLLGGLLRLLQLPNWK